MKHIGSNLTEYTDRNIKTLQEQYEENKKKLSSDLDLNVDDMVIFRKKELSKVQIVGKILSISENTLHVKTFVSFQGANEFYLDIREVKKYDSASNSQQYKKT
tara:strand:- start:191 stop:499 length:309 start_codon:yes stop_codon:yes gene_type:complete